MEKLINKRVLVSTKDNSWSSNQSIKEFKVLELSPSKRWIKVMNSNGQKIWLDASNFTPIEILEDLEKYPKNN